MESKTWQSRISKEYIKKLRIRAYNIFETYRDVFCANSLDYEDLMQEFYLTIMQVCEANPDLFGDDLFKFISKSISYKAKNLLRSSKRYKNRFKDGDTKSSKYIDFVMKDIGFDMNFEDLISGLTDVQKSIITMRVYEGLTFDEIARELKMSNRGVRFNFEKSVAKISKDF